MNPKALYLILIGALVSLSSMLHAQTSVFSTPDPNLNRSSPGSKEAPKLPAKAPAESPAPAATTKKPTSPAQQEASRQAIYAAFKQFEPELNYLVKHSDPYRRRPYSFRAKRYLDHCSRHMAAFPDDEQIVRSCLLNEALVYYHSGTRTKAIPSLSHAAQKMANEPSGQKAAELLLNLGQRSPQEVLPFVAELEKMPQYSTPEWREKFNRFRLQGATTEAAKEHDPVKRAQALEEVAKQYGQADEAAKLWAQVGTLYMQAGQLYLALNAWQKIVDQFAQKPEAPMALWSIATHLENANELPKAVKAYYQYATTYPTQERSDAALFRSCTLYVALEHDAATETCLAASTKQPRQVISLFDRILATREREQKEEAFSDLLDTVYLTKLPTTPEQKITALHRLYRLQRRLNRNNQETVQKILAISGPSPASPTLRRIVAEILFREVERAQMVFRDLKLLTDNSQSLTTSVQMKEVALQQITTAAHPVLSLNAPEWVTACYWSIAQSYEQMVMALQAAVKATASSDKKAFAQRAQQMAATAQQNFRLGADYAKKNRVMSIYALRLRERDIRQREPKYSFDDYVPIPDAISVDMPINLTPQLRGRL